MNSSKNANPAAAGPTTFRWTVPSGRTYTTIPTVYDL